MGKLIRIISIIMIGFVLLSFCIYRLRLSRALPIAPHMEERDGAGSEIQTAQGQISAVDPATRTIVLTNGSRSLIILLDDKTAVSESDHPVQSSEIVTGAKATVRYMKSGGKNLARSVLLDSPSSGQSY